MKKLLKIANEFESQIAKYKTVIDNGENLIVSPDVSDDLDEAIERTIEALNRHKEKAVGENASEKDIEQIRDHAGHLALLCNMMLNGKSYDEEEKLKAVLDI